MGTAIAERPDVAKKTGRPPKGRNDVSARIDAEVMRKAKAVASLLGKTSNEYLSDVLAPIVDRDLKRLSGEAARKPER